MLDVSSFAVWLLCRILTAPYLVPLCGVCSPLRVFFYARSSHPCSPLVPLDVVHFPPGFHLFPPSRLLITSTVHPRLLATIPPLAAVLVSPRSTPTLRVYSTSKPPWCQPWTITLTGSAAIGGAWLLFPSFPGSILAVGTTAAVSLWWWVFLIAYPQATLRYAAADERRAGGDDRR